MLLNWFTNDKSGQSINNLIQYKKQELPILKF